MLLALLAACADPPPPAATAHPVLPPLGSLPVAGVARASAPIAPVPGAERCVLLPGRWPGELTGCYDAGGRLRGVELDAPADRLQPTLAAVLDTYAPGGVEAVRAVGDAAWVSEGVRLEVVREAARVHVRALARPGA